MSGNEYGVTTTAPIVDATNNWWGGALGPYHPITNPSGNGDEVDDNVAYTPWLGACGGSPVLGNFRMSMTTPTSTPCRPQ